MDRQILSSVCEQIYRRFPQVSGKRPTMQDRPDGQFLLIFKGSATTADGRAVPTTVRVVVNASGKIVKTTCSR
jgi:hypothetical protein